MDKKHFEIDLTGVDTYGEFHTRIKNALDLPDYYGENLDALYDVLVELGDGWDIVFLHTRELEEALPRYAEKLKKLFNDAGREQKGLKIRFSAKEAEI